MAVHPFQVADDLADTFQQIAVLKKMVGSVVPLLKCAAFLFVVQESLAVTLIDLLDSLEDRRPLGSRLAGQKAERLCGLRQHLFPSAGQIRRTFMGFKISLFFVEIIQKCRLISLSGFSGFSDALQERLMLDRIVNPK